MVYTIASKRDATAAWRNFFLMGPFSRHCPIELLSIVQRIELFSQMDHYPPFSLVEEISFEKWIIQVCPDMDG
jgi:hypothetical protein